MELNQITLAQFEQTNFYKKRFNADKEDLGVAGAKQVQLEIKYNFQREIIKSGSTDPLYFNLLILLIFLDSYAIMEIEPFLKITKY